MKKHYCERDLLEMDRAGNHYGNHVMALTAEQLHSKSDIAAELGWRDMQIAELKAQRDALAENEGYKQAFYEIAEILGIGARPDSPKYVFDLVIKPKLEALMKERGKLASENITLAGLVTSWPQERCPVTEAVTDVQPDDLFPETSAYLNSVRAEGADKVAEYHFVRIDALKEVSRQGHLFHKAAYSDAVNVANLFRAGKDGE